MDDEKAEIDDELEVEQPEVDEPEEEEIDTEGEADDVVVSINGESPDPEEEEEVRAPGWVRELRKQYREEKRRAKELEQKVQQLEQRTQPAQQPLGQKPTLDSVDYDTERYETALAAWYEKKRQHDDRQMSVRAEQEAVQKGWEKKLEGYHSAKAELKVKDYDFAEDVVQDTLSVMQQGMIVQGAENPALLVYALGKNPKKAKELASITDPVKFAFAVAKLETNLKVTNRKASSTPEKKISGTGRPSGSNDSTLERLRAEAERTGNYSKVAQYKKQKRLA